MLTKYCGANNTRIARQEKRTGDANQQTRWHRSFDKNFMAGRNSANARRFVVAGKISPSARCDSKTKGSATAARNFKSRLFRPV
jgi:hypothetical protein